MNSEILKNYYKSNVLSDNFDFESFAMDVFHFQYTSNDVYKRFIDILGFKTNKIVNVSDIPYMPVSFFKNNVIKTGKWEDEMIFESSSTTGIGVSKHHIRDLEFYHLNSEICFNYFFGSLSDYIFFALLPSYLDRHNSSLIYMIKNFIGKSYGNFYNLDHVNLIKDIEEYTGEKKILLFGVTFALLSLIQNYRIHNKVIVVETGGMKGRGPELQREEMHKLLVRKINTESIFSEYGMTEMLSQAYSTGSGIFKSPPGMKIEISDITDPFRMLQNGQVGKVNIIDLANIDSCCFLATEDLGRNLSDGEFEILGRTDASEVRGCNLLYYN